MADRVDNCYNTCHKINPPDSNKRYMFTGPEIASVIGSLGITHVIWVPDSLLGTWEQALESDPRFDLLRVCREGEAWPLAAGLHLGGKRPLVVMQTTGMFESGDSLRNVIHDLRIPIFSIIGHRSYLVKNSPDTAKRFAEPILNAWGIEPELIVNSEQRTILTEHYRSCQSAGVAGVILIAEGSM